MIDVAPVGLAGERFTMVSTHQIVNGRAPFSVGMRYGGLLNFATSFWRESYAAAAS